MIFIQIQILLLLPLLSASGEPILARAKTSSLFCSRGFHPLDPQQGATPTPWWGPRWLTDSTAGRGPLAPSAGYFFLFSCTLQRRRFLLTRNLLAKAPCWTFPRRGGDGASQRFLLSPIFHFHNIKDGGYNNITNTNKVSPTQNTPTLQANSPAPWNLDNPQKVFFFRLLFIMTFL